MRRGRGGRAERAHDLAHEQEVHRPVVEGEGGALAGPVERRPFGHALAPLDVERTRAPAARAGPRRRSARRGGVPPGRRGMSRGDQAPACRRHYNARARREEQPMSRPQRMTRRQFARSAAAAAASLTILPRHVLGGPGHVAPSDTLTKAVDRRRRHGPGPPELPRGGPAGRVRRGPGAPGLGPGDRRPRRHRLLRTSARCWSGPTSTSSTSRRRPTGTRSSPWRPPRPARTSGARSR